MELPQINTMEDVARVIRGAGYEPRVLAKTVNDLPIYAVEAGGNRTPAILITAGVHAGEPSGPYAALALLRLLKTDHRVVIVPVRDPFAWEGYVRGLSYALGRSIAFNTRQEAEAILRESGEILYQEQGLLLAQVGELVFASKRTRTDTTGPQETWRRLGVLVREDPSLADALRGKRIILPTNLPQVEGSGMFDRAYTNYLGSRGHIVSLHDMFAEPSPPIEVQALKSLADEIKPGMAFDLHEGQGDSFYLFAYSVNTDLEERIARALLAGVRNRGYPIYTFADLKTRVGPEIAADYIESDPGVLIRIESFKPSGPPATLDAYCSRYGPAFLTETGRWHAHGLARRVSFHVWAVQSAADAFAEEHALAAAFQPEAV